MVAGFGGDGEAGRDRQAYAGHFGLGGAFAAWEVFHVAVAFGLAVAELIDVFHWVPPGCEWTVIISNSSIKSSSSEYWPSAAKAEWILPRFRHDCPSSSLKVKSRALTNQKPQVNSLRRRRRAAERAARGRADTGPPLRALGARQRLIRKALLEVSAFRQSGSEFTFNFVPRERFLRNLRLSKIPSTATATMLGDFFLRLLLEPLLELGRRIYLLLV